MSKSTSPGLFLGLSLSTSLCRSLSLFLSSSTGMSRSLSLGRSVRRSMGLSLRNAADAGDFRGTRDRHLISGSFRTSWQIPPAIRDCDTPSSRKPQTASQQLAQAQARASGFRTVPSRSPLVHAPSLLSPDWRCYVTRFIIMNPLPSARRFDIPAQQWAFRIVDCRLASLSAN